MNWIKKILIICFYLLLISCKGQNNRNTEFFKDTIAYELAKAVERTDLEIIEEIVNENPRLLEVTNPISGSNVLTLSIHLGKFESFRKLLQLGANPNFINPYSRESALMSAIRPFGNQFEWRIDSRFAMLLLQKGANPSYSINERFTDEKGHTHLPSSPMKEASGLNLDLVKLLVKFGADPEESSTNKTLHPLAVAVSRGKFDIANYFIDSLGVDVHQPMNTVIRKPKNEEVTFYIQDYATNKFTLAKIKGDLEELERLKKENPGIEEANEELWRFIQKLKRIGVNFQSYNYT